MQAQHKESKKATKNSNPSPITLPPNRTEYLFPLFPLSKYSFFIRNQKIRPRGNGQITNTEHNNAPNHPNFSQKKNRLGLRLEIPKQENGTEV